MNFIDDSTKRIADVGVIEHQFRNIDTDATIVVQDSILDNRFEVDAYNDDTVLNIER